jgi:hypothetical protein
VNADDVLARFANVRKADAAAILGDVIRDLSRVRQHNAMLVDLVADLTYDNYRLRRALERELIERVHADGALARARRLLATSKSLR